ncbi:MAG TPA: c-type cytochrome [Telluria sp.]|nr:c-type cytochrome [Telluria sp.]
MTVSLFAASLLAASPAFALDIQLPPETAVFKPSELPGYALAQRNCMTCHSVHYVQSQPPTSPRAYWEATVKKMKHPFGAQFSDADIPDLVDYLSKTYGAEHSVELPKKNAAFKPASLATPVAAGAIDAKALLAANACMGCHSIDKKIVGPAFKEVAAKYKGNADGLAMIAKNIRAGGAGKWGPVPMPAFAQLSEAEALALASYVMTR